MIGGPQRADALLLRALGSLLERHLTVPGTAGANASAKACSVVFGMVAGADSIDDLDLLRHGGMRRLLPDVRAPSTLGTFLRAFRFGHSRQLDAVAARLLTALSQRTPLLPGGVDRLFADDGVEAVGASLAG